MKHRPTLSTQGFSLVELAIVLGVVGTIIGGIWVAAASAQRTSKVSQSVTGIAAIADLVRTSYGSLAAIAKKDTAVTTTIPSELPTLPFSVKVCPWNYGTSTACSPAAATGQQFFAIEFTGLDSATCASLVTQLTASVPASGLKDVYINAVSTGASFPIPVPTATGDCTAASTIDVIYSLRAPTAF